MRHYQVGVLTPGLSYSLVLQGFRDEMAQLGYVAGKNVTLLVEIRRECLLTSYNTRRVLWRPDPMYWLP